MSEDIITRPTPIIEMSPEIGEIAKVLHKAQASMGDVIKTANNPAFKTKYADLGAVIEAVVPALNKHGITLLQPASFDGNMASVATMLLHESGQWVRCTLSSPLQKRDAQGIGSVNTYLRRYGLQAMSGVAPEDDDGNAAASKPPANAPRATPEPEGADWWGSDGSPGMSAYQAKKDGLDMKFEDLRSELGRLSSGAEWRKWCADNAATILGFPKAWRVIMRQEAEHMAGELGVDLNQRRAA